LFVEFAERERINRRDDEFDRCWPYCFVRLNAGGWLPLGRQYKPVGYDQSGYYDYDAYAHLAWRFDPIELSGGWAKISDHLYLYRGSMFGAAAFRDYFARLGRLIAVTDDPPAHACRLMSRPDLWPEELKQ
jgi:hypothetical protein